jgi:hypothetical protein
MPTDPGNPKKRSLKPPKDWFERKCAEVKKGNPDYSEEQVRATVGKIWYELMSKHQRSERRHEEGKDYGKAPMAKSVRLGLFPILLKSQKPNIAAATDMNDQESSIPAIVCEYYGKESEFEEMRVVTAAEVLDDPEKFDSRTFAYLIRNLGKKLAYEYGVDEQLKCTQVIIDLAEELESRIKEEKEARKKLEEERVIESGSPLQNNWQKKKEYFMGKSIMNLPIDNDSIGDYLSDAETPDE